MLSAEGESNMAKKRKAYTDQDIAGLPVKRKRYAEPDSDQRGLYIRITPKGAKSFVVVCTGLDGKQVWKVIGRTDTMSIEKAREEARRVIGAIHAGADLAGAQSFAAVADEWLKRHAKNLRSISHKRGHLRNHILPAWSGRKFEEIRRHDVVKLLDHIEDTAGAGAADNVLNTLSSICHWYSIRHENYVVPTVKGMRRTSQKERARERILNDEEIRAVWKAAEANGVFGAFVRLALLTAQRREKVASMRWEDVSVDGVWSIPSESREKTNAEKLPLPAVAVDIIRSQNKMAGNPFVLPGRGAARFNSFGRGKEGLDAKVKEMIGAELPHWTIHDCRRTARSLMSRAGIDFFTAERVLGHAVGGIIAQTYDRHDHQEQKGAALVKLAGLIEKIINPPADNVVDIRDAG
jgi:integrase